VIDIEVPGEDKVKELIMSSRWKRIAAGGIFSIGNEDSNPVSVPSAGQLSETFGQGRLDICVSHSRDIKYILGYTFY
jgi:hypothetical protein